ncbi:MAG TPA: hypothetical protein ENF94_00695 [Candidatus Woesearchaeota archaeon]|nr:MAG: hypothetical protein DRJ25_02885 [Candidatus Woesearchaeota archaeon]HDD70658.1 hypothetical protein [Candidatus Woesearchaeota archaeon]
MKSDFVVALIVGAVLLIGICGIVDYSSAKTGSYVARQPSAVLLPLHRTGQADYSNPYHSCYDSDGGKNFNVKGELSINGESWVDSCRNDVELVENFCMFHVRNAPQRGFVIYSCPYGCLDGKCLS